MICANSGKNFKSSTEELMHKTKFMKYAFLANFLFGLNTVPSRKPSGSIFGSQSIVYKYNERTYLYYIGILYPDLLYKLPPNKPYYKI